MIRTLNVDEGTPAGRIELHTFLLRSLKSQWREYREDFARCRKKFSEKSVHQFRVESRRLLSTISVMKAVTPGKALSTARRALKRRLRIVAPLRDIHVQLRTVEKLVRDHPELAAFRRALAKREKHIAKRVAKTLKRTGLRKVAGPIAAIRLELCSLLRDEKQEDDNLRAVLDEFRAAHRTVAARLRSIDPANPTTIHRTRVAFKKFRYMAEALRPILPGARDQMIERMHDYQSRMGDIQDASVLNASFEKFLSQHRTPRAKALLVRLHQRRTTLIRSFMKSAGELSDFRPLVEKRARPAFSRKGTSRSKSR
jgi:CHAD domain-containing protein